MHRRAHLQGPTIVPPVDRFVSIVDAVASVADTNAPGVVALRYPKAGTTPTARSALGRRMASLGFETVAAWSGPPGPEQCCRHVVLLVDLARCQSNAVGWVRALGDTSPRRHVVLLVGRGRALADSHHGADWAARIATVLVRADRAMAALELTEARTALMSAVAEARIRGTSVPDAVAVALAEAEAWAGCPPRPSAAGGAKSAEERGWRSLEAWIAGDVRRVHQWLRSLQTEDSPAARRWVSLIGLLRPWSQSLTEIRARLTTVLEYAGRTETPARWSALARAICARVQLELGDEGGARTTLSAVPWEGPAAVVRLALEQRLGAGRSDAARIDTHNALYVRAVEALGGRGRVDVIDGLSGLLHVIEDAEDEASALSAGCQWLKRLQGVEAVAVVSADKLRLVAAAGWKSKDLGGDVAAILAGPAGDLRRRGADRHSGSFGIPVRYGGAVLGHVVVKGLPTHRPAVEQAALTLAAVCGSALRARLDAFAVATRARDCAPEILGHSQAIEEVRAAIARAAPTSFPVLIEGESGTGKELAARALHRLSPRRDRRFAAVNCAALTDELFEAELFGHARGAFTGALTSRLGLIEEANGGTLFLDEVADLSPRGQAKLLRALQEREIRRVGENAARPIDVRTVAATNVPLLQAVGVGRFRDDLRFRLSVVRIVMPPLRERLEDLPALVWTFWRRAAAEAGKQAVLAPEALARLARHHWPGNVRELQNVIAGLAVVAPMRGRIAARHVDQVLAHDGDVLESAGLSLDRARFAFERRLVAATLARHAGRRTAAAAELGLTRQGLTKALRRLGLDTEEPTAGVA